MNAPKDGGPAFPVSVQPEFQFANVGMTLRDWFAGQAIASSMGRFVGLEHDDQADDEARGMAADAYRLADAMLAAREALNGEAS